MYSLKIYKNGVQIKSFPYDKYPIRFYVHLGTPVNFCKIKLNSKVCLVMKVVDTQHYSINAYR